MKYGDWQLRNESAYYPSPNVILYPSTNSVDEGMIHSEHNIRSIVRRLTNKNFALRPEHFHVTVSPARDSVTVSPGQANIQGYHLITNTPLSLKVPDNTVVGLPANQQYIEQYTLGISLSYDAVNHVTGDVVNSDKPLGQNEIFSGAYLYFFDKCQLRNNYDKILVLGRVWARGGVIVPDGTVIPADQGGTDTSDNGRYIEHGFEDDPLKDHGLEGSKVEVNVYGMETTLYDTIQENITTVYQYDTMKFPVEQDRKQYTKPPIFTTDLQDYINYQGDWVVSKYGDYMTGALRFDHLSLDRKIELDPTNAHEYRKDTTGSPITGKNGKYHGTEGLFVSPRGLGKLTNKTVDYDATNKLGDNGGTVMSVVPYTYPLGIDSATAGPIYAALISKRLGDTGLKLRAKNSAATAGNSRIVHYYNEISRSLNGDSLIIENNSTNKSSIDFTDGQMFFDSFNGAGFQFHAVGAANQTRNLDFRVDPYMFSMAEHLTTDSRKNTRSGKTQTGVNGDNIHFKLGLGSSYSVNRGLETVSVKPAMVDLDSKDPYMQLGNLRFRSNVAPAAIGSSLAVKLNTIDIANIGVNAVRTTTTANVPASLPGIQTANSLPYLRLMPSIYTRNGIAEDYIQVGTSKIDDVVANNANQTTRNKVVIGRINDTDDTAAYTFIEQDFVPSTGVTKIMNKMTTFSSFPPTTSADNRYKEIGGIYSLGNIGCSEVQLNQWSGRDGTTGPYQFDKEWVRFTRYRYDKDHDAIYGGPAANTGNHDRTWGSTYNIEFNTNKINERANQLIWNYKGSQGTAHQPLTLSHIHDEYVAGVNPPTTAKGTLYPDQTYYDHNLYLHKNPTFGVRDFLRLDGGGFSVHGDINNPTLAGDSRNNYDRFGMTLLNGRVYTSVYNDYAETYEKDNPTEQAEEGMIVELNPETGKYRVCNTAESKLVVGVISDNYGMLIGGKTLDSVKSQIESVLQLNDYAIGVSGKLVVNVDCETEPGDLLVSSGVVKGLSTVNNEPKIGTVIGKALSKAKKVDNKPYKQCLMQIMLG